MSACRDRKGFSTFTATLRRMVGNLKRKCKTLAAQRALVADLCAAPPSSPSFSSSAQSKLPHSKSSPLKLATASSTPQTAVHTAPIRIHKSPRPALVSTQHIPHINPHTEKKDVHTHPPLHSSPSPQSLAPCRCRNIYSVYRTLWAFIMLALLCTILCMGKEMAFVVATMAYLILQIVLEFGLLARGPNVHYTAQASCHPHHEAIDGSEEKDNTAELTAHMRPLGRSSSVPHRRGANIVTTLLRTCRRSKSWTQRNGLEEGKMLPSKVSSTVGAIAVKHTSLPMHGRGRNVSAGLKLPLMLLFTLCGLCHGRCLAMCIAVCCILICSKMERLFLKRRLRA